MGSPFFKFKQFTVWHDKCAMKVGTDGVLLGAWCDIKGLTVHNAQCTVLDIGTGSGLIALMLAQRMVDTGQCTMHDGASDHTDKDFHIDTIDIDEGAVEQARYNFGQSPWSDRLSAHLSSLQSWHLDSSVYPFTDSPLKYNLIVSNPPYFVDSLKNPDKGREQARHTDTLSYEELICHAARLLKKGGKLALVLPATAEEEIIRLAANYSLSPTRLTRVFSKPDRPTPIRILIEFCKEVSYSAASCNEVSSKLQFNELCISSLTSPRSEEYAKMTKDFYL